MIARMMIPLMDRFGPFDGSAFCRTIARKPAAGGGRGQRMRARVPYVRTWSFHKRGVLMDYRFKLLRDEEGLPWLKLSCVGDGDTDIGWEMGLNGGEVAGLLAVLREGWPELVGLGADDG